MFLLFFLPTGDHRGGWFFRQITKGMEKVAHRHCSEFNESYDYDKWNATIEWRFVQQQQPPTPLRGYCIIIIINKNIKGKQNSKNHNNNKSEKRLKEGEGEKSLDGGRELNERRFDRWYTANRKRKKRGGKFPSRLEKKKRRFIFSGCRPSPSRWLVGLLLLVLTLRVSVCMSLPVAYWQ